MPWFAKKYWLDHPRVILIDRSYYNQINTGKWKSEDWVSNGWMNKHGERDFKIGTGRSTPTPRTGNTGSGRIFLADYDSPLERHDGSAGRANFSTGNADTVRRHPDRKYYDENIVDALRRHKTAIGYRTTALVTAALEGLEVICMDEQNIMAQPNWLELLPYADWNFSEIQSGEAWEHLITHN